MQEEGVISMKREVTLDERLKKINDFFDNVSLDDFERMALDAGAGAIKESSKCSYVLASTVQNDNRYVNGQKFSSDIGNNEFFSQNDGILRGAA